MTVEPRPETRPETRTDSAGRPWEPWMYEQHEWVEMLRAQLDARFQELQDELVRSGRRTSERI